jgi:glutamate racemase
MTYKIGMFDSGVGGLSLANPLCKQLDGIELIYVADNAWVPYGNKSEVDILLRCQALCTFFIEQDCDLIVFACNTATAIAVDSCRSLFNIPIVAMEPAIKPAAKHSKSQSIAVCATENTLKQPRFERLIEHYATGVDVYRVACHGWVSLVESGLNDPIKARNIIEADLKAAFDSGADTLVLGCTHFPLLLPIINQVVSEEVDIIDPALAVVQVISDYYQKRDNRSRAEVECKPQHKFYYTDSAKDYSSIVRQYSQLFETIEFNPIAHSLSGFQKQSCFQERGNSDVD